MSAYRSVVLRRSGIVLMIAVALCCASAGAQDLQSARYQARAALMADSISNPFQEAQNGPPKKKEDRANPPAEQQQTAQKAAEAQKKAASPSADAGSPGHIFFVIPAYKVDYAGGKFEPLTSHEKFQEWAQGAYDPLGVSAGAVEAATLEHSSKDGFCGYGPGFGGYAKCFGSLELDSNISSFIGDYALTSLWHQDPRYFRLGKGGFPRRAFYAISRVFVTYNDQGHTVVYSSALTGTVAASAISNLYYPSQDRTFGHSATRVALDLGNTALYNGAAEFWPDIQRGFKRIF